MYQLTDNNFVQRLSDGAFIPMSTENADYIMYLKWIDEGNTPLPAPEKIEPPELTPQQKLQNAGLTVEDLKELLGLQ